MSESSEVSDVCLNVLKRESMMLCEWPDREHRARPRERERQRETEREREGERERDLHVYLLIHVLL